MVEYDVYNTENESDDDEDNDIHCIYMRLESVKEVRYLL